MDQAVAALIDDAERKAQRFAAYIRGLIAVTLVLALGFGRPESVPVEFIAVALGGIAGYTLLGVAAFVLADPRLFRTGMIIPFAVLDLLVYFGVLYGTSRTFGISIDQTALMPPFLFIFLLLALTAMRYSASAVAVQTGLVLVSGTAWLIAELEGLIVLPPQPLPADMPGFTPQAAFLRLILIGAVGLVLVLTVRRTRRLLIDAITVTRRTENLSRYLPPAIAARAAEEGVEALGHGRIQPAAVMFADIVGFTALAERMEPEALGRTLGQLRVLQREVIERHGGIVDKFIGDAVMAVFGVPEPSADDARNALAAALAMEAAAGTWNAERSRAGLPPLPLGIGLHYGDVFAGAIGDAQRLEFASIGDTVNVAQRVESLTRELGVSLLVTRAALDAAGADLSGWEALPPQAVKGRHGTVAVCRRRLDASMRSPDEAPA